VQDRGIVTVERYRNSYVLYRLLLFLVTWGDRNYPKPPYFRHFVSLVKKWCSTWQDFSWQRMSHDPLSITELCVIFAEKSTGEECWRRWLSAEIICVSWQYLYLWKHSTTKTWPYAADCSLWWTGMWLRMFFSVLCACSMKLMYFVMIETVHSYWHRRELMWCVTCLLSTNLVIKKNKAGSLRSLW